MSRPRHNAKPDFDVTGGPGEVSTSALSADIPVQQEAPSRRLHEDRPDPRPRQRSPREVLDRHLWQSRHGTLESDLTEKLRPRRHRFHSVGRRPRPRPRASLRRQAPRELPDTTFDYDEVLVDGEFAFLEWRGRGSDGTCVCDGADSYVIHDGRITAQSIHYAPRGASS